MKAVLHIFAASIIVAECRDACATNLCGMEINKEDFAGLGLQVTIAKAIKPQQVNIALETVLQFDKNDNTADLPVLDKVQNFLDQIKHGIGVKNARRSNRPDMKFTDFILEAAKILKNLNNNDLEEAYIILNDDTLRSIDKNGGLSEIFHNNDMRRFVSDRLKDVKELPAEELRRYLDTAINFIELTKKTGGKHGILELGNTVYKDAGYKLKDSLRRLAKLKKDNEFNLEHILGNIMKTLVHDHYLTLSDTVKNFLMTAIVKLWENSAGSDEVHNIKPSSHKSEERRIQKTKHVHSHHKKRDRFEFFVSSGELKKLTGRSKGESDTIPLRAGVSLNDQELTESHGKPKRHGKPHNVLRHSEKQTRGSDTNEKSSEYYKPLMGGQKMRNVNFRAHSSPEKSSLDEDKTHEITLQHSNVINVGLLPNSPGRLNITIMSVEEDSQKRDAFTIQRRISGFNNNTSRRSEKGNLNETLAVKNHTLYLEKLLKNLEVKIEEVNQEFEVVKNLASKTEVTDGALNDTDVTAAERLETDKPSVMSFRSHPDSSETKLPETNQNNTNETAHKSIYLSNENTTVNEINKFNNKSFGDDVVGNVNNKTNYDNIDKDVERDKSRENVNDKHDDKKTNDVQRRSSGTTTSDVRNETIKFKDDTNKTENPTTISLSAELDQIVL